MPKRRIQPDQKVPLKLTAAERTLLLEGLTLLPTEHEESIRCTPPNEPVLLSLGDLDDFAGFVAADANHAKDKRTETKLDAIFQKMQDLLDTYTDEEPPNSNERKS